MAQRKNRQSARSSAVIDDHLRGLRLLDPVWARTLPDRIERFKAGQMSTNGIVILMQDCMQVGCLEDLPEKFVTAAVHCCNQGLCTPNGRLLQ